MVDGWFYINISGLGIGPMYLEATMAPRVIGAIINLGRRVSPGSPATVFIFSNGSWNPLPTTF